MLKRMLKRMLKQMLVVLVLVTGACASDTKPDQDSGLPPDDALSLDEGATPDGPISEDGAVDPDGPLPAVEWCTLQWPPSATIAVGGTMTAFGQVFVPGATEGEGAGANIEGQLGHGPAGSDGSTDAGWTWTSAAYNKDEGNNDEYIADLSPPEGSYAYAYRFRFQGGLWLYCDLDGSENGFDADQQGALTVEPEAQPVLWKEMTQVSPVENVGASTLVKAEIYLEGVTDGAGQGAGITAQLGYGPRGVMPSDASWSWQPATYEGDSAGGGTISNDVYSGWLVAPAVGSYDVSIRFTWGGQDHYADTIGTTAGYALAEAAHLDTYEAQDPPQNDVGWCDLHWPPTSALAPGATTDVFGQVYVQGVTNPAGSGPGITGELGLGPDGSDPRTAQWTWTGATFNVDAGNNDELMATLVAPSAAGTYSYIFRFRYQNGWTYCDTDGADGTSTFDPASSGALTVNP